MSKYSLWLGGGGVNHGGDDLDQNFDTNSRIGNYKGTTLAYDLLWDPISSDNEWKEGDKLSDNCLVNLKHLTTSIEKNLVWWQCAHDQAILMKYNSKTSYLMLKLRSKKAYTYLVFFFWYWACHIRWVQCTDIRKRKFGHSRQHIRVCFSSWWKILTY